MRSIRFLTAALGLLTVVANAATAALDRFFTWLIGLMPVTPQTFTASAPALALSTPGQPLSSAMQHSLRHEAGHRKRAAMRGI